MRLLRVILVLAAASVVGSLHVPARVLPPEARLFDGSDEIPFDPWVSPTECRWDGDGDVDMFWVR